MCHCEESVTKQSRSGWLRSFVGVTLVQCIDSEIASSRTPRNDSRIQNPNQGFTNGSDIF